MRLISHWLRRPESPRMAITLAGSIRGNIGSQAEIEKWSDCFRELDQRGLSATWASVVPTGSVALAAELVASRTAHELSFRMGDRNVAESLAPLEERAAVLRDVGLPLRSLVCDSPSVHPGVMTRLGVEALISVSPEARTTRTGSLRAVAWNQWETPLSDRCTTAPSAHRMNQLANRLNDCIKHGWTMHLLCVVEGKPSGELLRLFDQVSQYAQRGWIVVEPTGQLAENASRRAAGRSGESGPQNGTMHRWAA